MRYIPTEKDLRRKIKLVELKVKGEYIARIDEKRRTFRKYEVSVMLPEGFTKSDIKRLTPRVLLEHKDYPDFMSMRTFFQVGIAKKSDKMTQMENLYSQREVDRFAKLRKEAQKFEKEEVSEREIKSRGGAIVGDTSEYDPDTGLPKVVNDGEEDAE